jgi:amino acid adenylation domain-containing protein
MGNDLNSILPAQAPALSSAKQALLSKWLRGGANNGHDAGAQTIPRRRNSDPAPLSLEQQRIWFFNQLEPDSPLYNMPIASRLRGVLHPQVLQQAMDLVVARHEALRTHFAGEQPVQTIDAPSPVPMQVMDFRKLPAERREADARQLLEAEAKRPFNLAHDLMVRGVLVRMAEDEWIFLVLMHHIASDDWSWRVFCSEVADAYEAIVAGRKPELAEPALQYADFSVWQKDWSRGEELQKRLDYWRKQLDGAPPVLNLPLDHPRPAAQTFRGACEWLKLPAPLAEKLNALGQRGGFTPFMILLAAFQTLLLRYTGREDIIVGSPVAGRTHVCLDKVIGVFVNMLALRTKLEGNPTFAELLRRIQTTVLEALAQQDLPFEKLVEELQPQRSASYSPLIQVMFALQDELSENLKLPGITTSPFPLDPGTAKFDLTFTIVKNASGLDCCAEYNTDLFEPKTVRRMLAHYQNLLESVAANPEQRLSDLPLLSPDERSQVLVEWNRTEIEFPRDKCVHDLFAAQAAVTPKAVAVVFGDQSLTYEELDWRSNQLARHLKFIGGGLVAVCMDRSLEMIVALLGILKAGGAYIPLDPSYPIERLRFMIDDSQCSLLLTRSEEKKRLGNLPENVRAICLDTDWTLISEERDDALHVEMDPENPAYVIYTSGSTGTPKGVAIPHRAVVNFLHSMRREPGLNAADVLVSVTSFSFDIAALEIFLPLTVGARLVLAGAEQIFDAEKMKALLRDSSATAMQATPSFWQFLVEAGWRGSERLKILCGGEALSRELANKLIERASEVWNLYGPTETTIWSTLAKITPGEEPISIGRPIANTQIYILDYHLQPVPVGVLGELYIGGEGLARGYLNQPELTAAKFIANPFAKDCSRLYKTGDLARYRADGSIECLGRNDFQIKLRGHRIDLGEIESALRAFSNVLDAVVLLREDEPGQKRLIGYLQHSATATLELAALPQFLKAKLPDYMVPGAFVVLERFPLTPNGKINRKVLPPPESTRPMSAPPRTATEEALAKLWRELLALPQVGVDDNFFKIGGHSLLAMQLMARMRSEFNAELSLRNIFESPTIAELAAILDRAQAQSTPPGTAPVPRARRITAERAKELLGRIDQLSEAEVELLLQQVSAESEARV